MEVDSNSNDVHHTTVTFHDDRKSSGETSLLNSQPPSPSRSLCRQESEKTNLLSGGKSSTYVRPRMASVFFMVDSSFAGGITSRANYMTRCFLFAWERNRADIAHLDLLLWNGESSRQTLWKAVSGLVAQWFFALAPTLLFVAGDSSVLQWILFCLSLSASLWYAFALTVLLNNKRNWRRAWFTFQVPLGTIGLVDSGHSEEMTLFHCSANIRFVKLHVTNLWTLTGQNKRDEAYIERQMQSRGLITAEVIVYTESFLHCYSTWPLRMTGALLGFSVAGLFLVIYYMVV